MRTSRAYEAVNSNQHRFIQHRARLFVIIVRDSGAAHTYGKHTVQAEHVQKLREGGYRK